MGHDGWMAFVNNAKRRIPSSSSHTFAQAPSHTHTHTHTHAHTPITHAVGEACLNWGTLLPQPIGLYISYHRHKGNVQEVVNTWPEAQVRLSTLITSTPMHVITTYLDKRPCSYSLLSSSSNSQTYVVTTFINQRHLSYSLLIIFKKPEAQVRLGTPKANKCRCHLSRPEALIIQW